MGSLPEYWIATLLVALRLAPTLAFAPPFTLLRIPVLMRVMIALGLSLWLVGARPGETVAMIPGRSVVALVAGELAIGTGLALGLQLVFAAIYFAGRTIDIQAGFGLAMLADPTTHAQVPLAGTILAYVAAMLFFATGAQYDLLALWTASFETLPLGTAMMTPDPIALGRLMSGAFLIGIGLVGVVILAIFMADLVIAFLSRTLPQMNVLLLGFQVKAMVMLVVLPISIALSGALFLRLLRIGLAGSGDLIGGEP